MRLFSRVGLVGIVLVLVMMLVACQPVQPVAESPENAPASSATDGLTPAAVTALVNVEAVATVAPTQTVTPTIAAAAEMTTPTASATNSAITSTVATVPSEAATADDAALMVAGLAAYRAQYCGVCHILDAAETRGTFGPPHNGMGATAALHLADAAYAGAATTPAEYILESIVDPQAFIVPGYATTSHRMPPYAHLDAATLDALVAFLLAQ